MIRWFIRLIDDALGEAEKPSAKTVLPIETQNYIDNRIRDAAERIKEQNERIQQQNEVRTREIIKERLRWWDKLQNQLGIIGILIGVFSFIGLRDFLRKRAEQAALDYLTTNVVQQAMMNTFRSNVSHFTQTELLPLQTQIAELTNVVVLIRDQVAREQAAIQKRVELQEAYLGARIGSLHDYRTLIRLAKETNEVGSLARSAREEVAQFFGNYVRSPEKKVIADAVSQKPYVYSVEDAIRILASLDLGNRIAGAVALTDLQMKSTVATICQHIEEEGNLFVIEHLIQALRRINAINIGVLDVDGVQIWWNTNRTNEIFGAPYAKVIDAFKPKIVGNSVQALIPDDTLLKTLDELIAREPNACWTRAMRGQTILLNSSKFDEVEHEILEIDRRLPNYFMNFDLKARFYFAKGQTNESIDALNKCFDAKPSVAVEWRNSGAPGRYMDLLNDPRIKWPPQSLRGR